MARSAIWVLHGPVSASIDGAEPAKHGIIRGGCEFAGSPWGPSHVERVGHHKLAPVEVGTQHKGDPLHPLDHCPSFRSHLDGGRSGQVGVRDKGPQGVALLHCPQNTHSGIRQGVISGQGQVVIGDSVGHQPVVLCFPQWCVEVSKIMVKVNALLGPAALCPAHQLRTLQEWGLGQPSRLQAPGEREQCGPQPRWLTRRKAVS